MPVSPVVPEVSLLTRIVKTVLSWIGIRDEEQKMRENASNWLELAEKVYHYRRDVLPDVLVGELQAHIQTLKQVMKERQNAAKLKLEIEALENVLRRTGGTIYPKTALVENVEFFLVAAIVILGIRTYFVQPFKIPTNSMWPTYYGMTGENFPPGTEAPGTVERAFRFAAFGAFRKEVVAPRSGEVSALFYEGGQLAANQRPGKKWLVFPTTLSEYTFFTGGDQVTLKLPVDFHEFDRVVIETFFGTYEKFAAEWQRLEKAGKIEYVGYGPYGRVARVPLGKTVNAGDLILRFDLLTGDQLFVDRMSYHFVKPKVGQGFVFRTGNIPGIAKDYGDQYYIKRLVGLPGDVMQIRPPVLLRNGQPIEGADAFRKNATREGKYGGYVNGVPPRPGDDRHYLLTPDEKLTVPSNFYFALGDNSRNSADGRYWGFVPAKDVAGRPLFIYYPFTRRWGPAR